MSAHMEFENAAVRLVSCMHPSDGHIVLSRGLVLCEMCGSATRDGGRSWRAPTLVQELADACNVLASEVPVCGVQCKACRIARATVDGSGYCVTCRFIRDGVSP